MGVIALRLTEAQCTFNTHWTVQCTYQRASSHIGWAAQCWHSLHSPLVIKIKVLNMHTGLSFNVVHIVGICSSPAAYCLRKRCIQHCCRYRVVQLKNRPRSILVAFWAPLDHLPSWPWSSQWTLGTLTVADYFMSILIYTSSRSQSIWT